MEQWEKLGDKNTFFFLCSNYDWKKKKQKFMAYISQMDGV
jgi:hypothetical protein